jgi:cell wall-associated NlpC family hydrolase
MRRLFLILLAANAVACATTGAVPQPFPTRTPSAPAKAPSEATSPDSTSALPPPAVANGYEISGAALAFRGVRYRNGGSDPSGFDCSGFVWYVFNQQGVPMPRTVTEQFRAGAEIDPRDLRAGDLVFFDTINSGVRQVATHVGIAIGGDEFVHAPSSTGEVRVERLASTYWSPRFVGARRIANP